MENLLEELYSCIVDTRNWNIFCDKLAVMFNSSSVEIILVDEKNIETQYASSCGISMNTQSLLLSYMPYDDPRIIVSKNNTSTSHIFNANSTTTLNTKLVQSNLYKEILSKNNINNHLVTGINIDKNKFIYINICRQHTNIIYTQKDIAILNKIKPHILRSIKIQNKYSLNDKFIRAGLNNLKENITGSIIINENNKVFFINEYAQRLVDAKDGILILNGMLYFGNFKKSILLSKKVDLKNISGGVHHIHIPREESSDLQIKILPFNTRHAPFQPYDLNSNMVKLLLMDPERKVEMNSSLLKNVFGLTPSETRVVNALSHNCNMKDTQNQLNISANTAKSHLKKIFVKMNVSSQVELVKLITTSHYWQ